MSSDLDHFAPKDLATAPIEDGSRRHFLAQGGALTGATLAAPALMGLGALATPASAGMAGTGRKTRFDITSPIWASVSQMMEAAGFRDTAWVDVEWNDTPWSGGGSVEGVVSIGERTKWGVQARNGAYSFGYSYFYNEDKKYDILPQSIYVKNNYNNSRTSPIPAKLAPLIKISNNEDAPYNIPENWRGVLRWFERQVCTNNARLYEVNVQNMGSKLLGCASTIYTVTRVRHPTGEELLFPVLLGTYTVLRGYIGSKYTPVFIPNVTTPMNGLFNSWDAGVNMLSTFVTAGVLTVGALIDLIGKGVAYTTVYTDRPDVCGDDLKAIWSLAQTAVFLGGVGATLVIAHSIAVMRSRTALLGLLMQLGSKSGDQKVFQWGDAIPLAGWEPRESYTHGR